MEILIAVLIVVLLVRWVQMRDRLKAMDERMDALQRQLAWARRTGELAGPAPVAATPVATPHVVIPPMGPVPPAPVVPAAAPFAAAVSAEPVPAGATPSVAPVPPGPVAAAVPPAAPAVEWAAVSAEPAAAGQAPLLPDTTPSRGAPWARLETEPRASASGLPVAPVEPAPPPALEPAPAFAGGIPPEFLAGAQAARPQPARPARTWADWEALVGGNWANKAGVFLVVVGMAVALGLSFKSMSPWERVLLSVAASLALLISGAVFEKRERYRTFARGLLGGGWAALYFTVYAAQAIDAAKVIDSPVTGALLLLAVGVGMVVHSLRYRSETVTGIAYFLAFATLGITQVTALSVIALVPLAASLLYLAHRFGWRTMALVGLVATYGICALQHDTGAPLWEAQAIFTVYWLLFEGFDILHPSPALLPLNAIGFLGLSAVKWHLAAPGREWQIVAATGLAYLVSTVVRARRSEWRLSVTLTGALAAAAIFLELEHQWIALALLIEAELYYLAGLRFGSRYLRILAAVVFGLELNHLIAADSVGLPYRAWTPVAALTAVVFYANRTLRAADVFYGYAGAFMVALVAGFEAQADRGLAWSVLAAGPFLVGWLRRLPDFRYQAYGLATLGLLGMVGAWDDPPVSLAIAAALAYAAVLSTLWGPDRFLEGEAKVVRLAASLEASGLAAALVWQLTPAAYRGLAWMGLALGLLELGMRNLPRELRRQGYALAALGAFLAMQLNILPIGNSGPLAPRLIPVWAALAAYAMAARARQEEDGKVLKAATFVGTFFAMVALWALLPVAAVGPAWAALAVILAETGVPVLRLEAGLVSGAVVGRLAMSNLEAPERLLWVTPVLVSHYYLWWRTRWRFYLYTGTALAAALIYYQGGDRYRAAGWALFTVALFVVGHRRQMRDLCWQSYALAALAFAACWAWNLAPPQSVLPAAVVVACLYGAQLVAPQGGWPRLYYLLAAALLAAALLYFRVSGSLLTVAWGLEGIALLAAGFPLSDRNQRLGGLALLMFCILKVFFYDLRHLGTVPYTLSLVALGLILLAVSWIYTRFRESVQRFL
ncbi:MAG: DUF2339 domain-containing protein [Bryobacteraceae bacterium]